MEEERRTGWEEGCKAVDGEKRYVLLRTPFIHQTAVDGDEKDYSDELLWTIARCANAGAPGGFNAQSMVGKSKHGDAAIRLFAVIDPANDTVARAGFKARGSLAIIACASKVCEMIEGRSLYAALKISAKDIEQALGGLPEGASFSALFATEAVRALVGDWLARQGATRSDLDDAVGCDIYSVECLMCEHCSLRDIRADMLVAAALGAKEVGCRA